MYLAFFLAVFRSGFKEIVVRVPSRTSDVIFNQLQTRRCCLTFHLRRADNLAKFCYWPLPSLQRHFARSQRISPGGSCGCFVLGGLFRDVFILCGLDFVKLELCP